MGVFRACFHDLWGPQITDLRDYISAKVRANVAAGVKEGWVLKFPLRFWSPPMIDSWFLIEAFSMSMIWMVTPSLITIDDSFSML